MEQLARYLGDRLMGRVWFHSAKATTVFTESARLTPALAVQATAPPRFWGSTRQCLRLLFRAGGSVIRSVMDKDCAVFDGHE